MYSGRPIRQPGPASSTNQRPTHSRGKLRPLRPELVGATPAHVPRHGPANTVHHAYAPPPDRHPAPGGAGPSPAEPLAHQQRELEGVPHPGARPSGVGIPVPAGHHQRAALHGGDLHAGQRHPAGRAAIHRRVPGLGQPVRERTGRPGGHHRELPAAGAGVPGRLPEHGAAGVLLERAGPERAPAV